MHHSSSAERSAAPTPITWRNLARWLAATARVDRDLYRHPGRPRSLGRILRSAWPPLDRPLFVVGAPRSGTSFLGDACGRLPEFSYHYEPPVTKAAARYVHDGLWGRTRARRFYRAVYRWLLAKHLDGDLRFAEKTPQNCFVMDFLAEAFPGAQFLAIVRDGRDAALSYLAKPWLRADAAASGRRESGGYRLGPFARFWVEPERRSEFEGTADFHRCIWAWRRHTEAALGHAERLGARCLVVRYEQVAAAPRREADRILDFLAIAAPESRQVLGSALAEVRQDSVERWRRELTPEQRPFVLAEAEPLLHRLGYAETVP